MFDNEMGSKSIAEVFCREMTSLSLLNIFNGCRKLPYLELTTRKFLVLADLSAKLKKHWSI